MRPDHYEVKHVPVQKQYELLLSVFGTWLGFSVSSADVELRPVVTRGLLTRSDRQRKNDIMNRADYPHAGVVHPVVLGTQVAKHASSDAFIKDSIKRFLSLRGGDPAGDVLVVLSGDGDFYSELQEAKLAGMAVFMLSVHDDSGVKPCRTNAALHRLPHWHMLWPDFVKAHIPKPAKPGRAPRTRIESVPHIVDAWGGVVKHGSRGISSQTDQPDPKNPPHMLEHRNGLPLVEWPPAVQASKALQETSDAPTTDVGRWLVLLSAACCARVLQAGPPDSASEPHAIDLCFGRHEDVVREIQGLPSVTAVAEHTLGGVDAVASAVERVAWQMLAPAKAWECEALEDVLGRVAASPVSRYTLTTPPRGRRC